MVGVIFFSISRPTSAPTSVARRGSAFNAMHALIGVSLALPWESAGTGYRDQTGALHQYP